MITYIQIFVETNANRHMICWEDSIKRKESLSDLQIIDKKSIANIQREFIVMATRFKSLENL